MYLAIDAKEMAPNRYLTKFYGLSTDTKPTEDLANGSIFIEIDTSTAYFFDEENEEWLQAASSAVDPQAIADAVAAYLDAHPEAVTTVQDGAITYAKLDSSLKDSVDDVSDLKNEVEEIEDTLVFDNSPTSGSTKLVKSGGIYDAIASETTRATTAEGLKVNKPTSSPNGTSGQFLKTNGDGTTTWDDPLSEPVADAVEDWLDDHPEATTTVQDESLTESKFTAATLAAIKNNYVTPEMFGAVGDGVTDDAEAIQDAVDYCIENGVKLKFMQKTYGVIPWKTNSDYIETNTDKNCMVIKGSIDIDLNGATLKVLTNTVSTFVVILIILSDGVTIRNGTIIGDRDTCTVAGDSSKLIKLFDSKNVTIDRVTMKDSKGDCLGIDGVESGQQGTKYPFSDFYMGNVISNCLMDHAARHGMTVFKCRGVTIENVRIQNTDKTGVPGGWDGKAVDMEPWFGFGSIFDIKFIGCSMENNTGGGPYFQHANELRIENCYLQGLGFRSSVGVMVSNTNVLGTLGSNSSEVTVRGCNVGGNLQIVNQYDLFDEIGKKPKMRASNNVLYKVLASGGANDYPMGILSLENNIITAEDTPIKIYGYSGKDLFPNTSIKNNHVEVEGNGINYAACVWIENVPSITIEGNSFYFDCIDLGWNSCVFTIDNVDNARIISNIIQPKFSRDETYVKRIGKVVNLKNSSGKLLLCNNIINPENVVFSDEEFGLLNNATSETAINAVVTNNYFYGSTKIVCTNSNTINLVVNEMNVLNNTDPLTSAVGVSF